MPIDFERHLGAMQRTVVALERDGQPARAVVLSRIYDTAAADLWNAITDPPRLRRWFLPVTGELRLGGRYQLEGNAGGTITACEPPQHLALTWEFGGGVSWVTVRLQDEGKDKARLTLEHIAPITDHWTTYGPGAVGVGWDLGLAALAAHIIEPSEKLDEATFSATEAGKLFIRGSSSDWERASVAAGTNVDEARKAARATTAFYTGQPPGD